MDTHIAAIQLRRGKTLLEKLAIKKWTWTWKSVSMAKPQMLDKARSRSIHNAPHTPNEPPEQSTSSLSMVNAPETRNTLPDGNINDHDLTSDSTIDASEMTPNFTTISLAR